MSECVARCGSESGCVGVINMIIIFLLLGALCPVRISLIVDQLITLNAEYNDCLIIVLLNS